MQHFLFSCASPPSHRKGRLIKFDDDDDNNDDDDDVIKLLSKYIVQYSFLFSLFKKGKRIQQGTWELYSKIQWHIFTAHGVYAVFCEIGVIESVHWLF